MASESATRCAASCPDLAGQQPCVCWPGEHVIVIVVRGPPPVCVGVMVTPGRVAAVVFAVDVRVGAATACWVPLLRHTVIVAPFGAIDGAAKATDPSFWRLAHLSWFCLSSSTNL